MEPGINNPILKIANEHELFIKYTAKLDQLLSADDSELISGLKILIPEFCEQIEAHFEREEKVIFPGALGGFVNLGHIDLVIELAKEHGILISDFHDIQAWVENVTVNDQELIGVMKNKIARFNNVFKNHAKREVEILFPIIHDNPNSKILIQQRLD